MKSNQFLTEGIVEDAHEMHQDHEVQMAREECYHAAGDAISLHKLLKHISEQQGIEGWVAAKITLAADYLKTVREYLEYELMSANQGANGAVQQRLPVAEGLITSEDFETITEVNPHDFDSDVDYYAAVRAQGRPKHHTSAIPRRHPDDPDFMDPDQRRLRADQARVAKAQAEYQAKKKQQGVAEGSLQEYGDTAKGQKMLTKVQKRAVDRMTSKKADTDTAYARKNQQNANAAWERMTDKDVAEGSEDLRAKLDLYNEKAFEAGHRHDDQAWRKYTKLAKQIADQLGLKYKVTGYGLEIIEQGVAEGLERGEYSRVLGALQLYYPRVSMEELNVPGYHKVIANKANVPVEYAAQVINDFVRANDPNDYEDWPEDDDQGIAEELTMKHQRQHTTQTRPDTSNSLAKRTYSGAEVRNITKSADGHPTIKYRTDSTGKSFNSRVEPTITPTSVKRKDSDRPIPSFLKKEVSEMSSGSVATVVNPTPRNKAKTGTLFGGTYKQKKTK